MLNPVELSDFSGGFTDNYLGSKPNKSERLDNFILTSNAKLRGRDGSVIIDANYYQIPDGAVRLGTLIPFGKSDTLFWHYARKLYYVDGGFQNLTGPSGNQAFDLFTTADYLNWGEWQKQIFAVPSSGTVANPAYPVRFYRDENSDWQLRTAGLPKLDTSTANYTSATVLASLITLANDLRTKMLDHYGAGVADTISRLNAAKTIINNHVQSTVFHVVAQSPAITAADATDVASAVTLAKDIQSVWNVHVTDSNLSSGWTYHYAQLDKSGFGLPDSLPITGIGSVKDYLVFLATFYNNHDANLSIHGGAGGSYQIAAQTSQYIYHDDQDSDAEAILTSSAATDLPSLLTLVNQMCAAYRVHLSDAVNAVPTIHRFSWPFPGTFWGDRANFDASNLDTPLTFTDEAKDLETVASNLNELRLRWNIHSGKAYYHGGVVDGDSTNITAELPVSNVVSGPYVLENWSALYNSVTELRSKFISHMEKAGSGKEHQAASHNSSGDLHTPLSTTSVTTPTILADALLELRGAYYMHMNGGSDVGAYAGYHYASALIEADTPDDPVIYSTGTIYSSFGDAYSAAPPYLFDRQVDYINDLRAKFKLHIAESAPHNSIVTGYDSPRGDDLELASYVYALHYEYTYYVGSTEYLDRGPVIFIQADQVPTVETQAIKIMALPVLTNTGQQNYDTSNLKIRIARTVKNGTALYYCGQVTNGTTSFTDSMSDDTLLLQEPLYTEGGIVANDPPPMAKAFHIADDVGYYGNVVVDGEVLEHRVMQSHLADIDSVPASFYIDLEYPVTFISSAKSKVIVGTDTKIYRIDGTFDERGQGGMTREKIGDIGSECPQSAVQAADGVFYLGTDGIYYTDGYQTLRINEDWTSTYQDWISTQTKRDRIQGFFDEKNRLVYWTVQATAANTENDSILVLDLRWGIRPDSTFLTWSGSDSFRPSAIAVFDKNFLRGDSRGYVFQHGSAYTSDPKVNTGAVPSTWAKQAIVWDYISGAPDFGDAKVRKFIPSMTVFARNLGNLSLQAVGYNDDQETGKELAPIRFRSQYTGIIREQRMMPAGGLRCSYKQIQLTNAEVIITNSDTLGNASVNAASHTVTLDSAVTEDWPADAIDWKIYFDKKDIGAGNVDDDYTTGYPITGRTDDTLTFTDAGGTAPSGSVKWILKGTPKDEVFELNSIHIDVMLLGGNNQMAYSKSETGGNA